jgi:hypothetical protein
MIQLPVSHNRLEISKYNSEKAITILHEIGHLIDLLVIGIPGQFESSNADGKFVKLLTLAFETPEITKIDGVIRSGHVRINSNLVPLPHRAIIALCYLLDPHEIVARSYAQYIAEKSKSQKLLKMIRSRNNSSKFGEQWSSDSFRPILAEWDDILNSIGWQTKK